VTTFFTSDTHFNDPGILRHCRRPFGSVEDMTEALIANWNDIVKDGDEVYHLGDFGWRKSGEVLARLRGTIRLVPGNHDNTGVRRAFERRPGAELLPAITDIRPEGQRIILCHYAMRTWPGSHRGAWHLYGHSHGMLDGPPGQPSFDIGVDVWNFRPIALAEVKEAVLEQVGRGRLPGPRTFRGIPSLADLDESPETNRNENEDDDGKPA
jgi:calcineurin-like phosphoesterase family protein